MNSASQNYFAQLSNINVNDHLEKKGQFSYLSWPFAVAQLRLFDESATWQVLRFNGLPFLYTENGTFVEVAVTVRGVTLSQIHPVLDSKNRPLLAPNAFDINSSIQRCLVKAIALHGLGLNVYAGEDLPIEELDGSNSVGTSPLRPVIISRSSVSKNSAQLNQPSAPKSLELLTANQLRYIKRLINETGADEAHVAKSVGCDEISTIPKIEVNKVIRMLESNRKEVA